MKVATIPAVNASAIVPLIIVPTLPSRQTTTYCRRYVRDSIVHTKPQPDFEAAGDPIELPEEGSFYAGEAVILCVASNDDPREAQRFLDDLGPTYPNVFGTDGTIRARVNGGISEQRLAGLIEDALG